MSANNSALKGVLGSKWGSVGKVEENQAAADRRRSSASSGNFSGLMNYKRGSGDAAAAARKTSFTEQTKPPGFFGGMWQNFTKGSGK